MTAKELNKELAELLTAPKRSPKTIRSRARLSSLLHFFGVRKLTNDYDACRNSKVSDASAEQLWQWYEHAKLAYRDKIARAHPDRGGNHAEAATLNAAWERTEMLFKRLGINV